MIRSTTIIGVKIGNKLALGGDGQVTHGDNIIFKSNAQKVRTLYNGKVIAGFAGATADALTLFERFESKLQKFKGNLLRASVEVTKEWRTDKMLRRLEAMIIVGDTQNLLIVSGNGDVIEPDNNIAAIGSGGPYALAAAMAMVEDKKKTPKQIVKKSLEIASNICVYTNSNHTIKEL
ncbi:MAG: ATP-dependent protease subunit HslV [Candidatus Cloacimonadota bacterium]|nr:ATP-dependent protease subunit HslV [Candidatus Cloacimonadota bacterium]